MVIADITHQTHTSEASKAETSAGEREEELDITGGDMKKVLFVDQETEKFLLDPVYYLWMRML